MKLKGKGKVAKKVRKRNKVDLGVNKAREKAMPEKEALVTGGKDVLKRDKKTAARTRTRRRESTESPTKKQCMPNVLITGTPGTGKTRLSALIAEKLGLKHIDGGNTVIQAECYSGRHEEFDSLILDEDKLVKTLRKDMEGKGGSVLDFHTCDIFPPDWFDLVLVLRASTEVLYDRLENRGYAPGKVSENIECEIMQVVAEDAVEAYPNEVVHQLMSDTTEDLQSNLNRVSQWLEQWKIDHCA